MTVTSKLAVLFVRVRSVVDVQTVTPVPSGAP
jgi:hypothetical protein